MQRPPTAARSVLGSSAVTVPRIGIGAGTLSNSDGPAALIGALEAGLRRGLNYVDTAPLYLDGGSERAVGEFVSGHRREDIVLSTKVGRLADAPGRADAAGREPTGSRRRFDYSRRATVESVAASMARLRVDHLNAVIIHDVDTEMHPHFESSYRSAVGRCYPALAQLKRSGVIGAIGLSTRQPAVARRALSDVDLDLLMMAGTYTLLHHAPLAGLFPESQLRGVPVVIASPFNSGILATGDPGSLRLWPGGPRCGASAGRARRGIASPRREPRIRRPAVPAGASGGRLRRRGQPVGRRTGPQCRCASRADPGGFLAGAEGPRPDPGRCAHCARCPGGGP